MSINVKTNGGMHRVVNIGKIVDMSLEEFKDLIKTNNFGYANSMSNLLKLVFTDVTNKLKELDTLANNVKDEDLDTYVRTQNTMSGLVICAKKVEDKLLFLKEYIGNNSVLK